MTCELNLTLQNFPSHWPIPNGIEFMIFWVVMPCSGVVGYQSFGGLCCCWYPNTVTWCNTEDHEFYLHHGNVKSLPLEWSYDNLTKVLPREAWHRSHSGRLSVDLYG